MGKLLKFEASEHPQSIQDWWNGPAFEEFWEEQLRKEKKARARRYWRRLCPPNRQQGEALLDRIAAVWGERAASWQYRDKQYIPYPSTFLRDEEF
jgi:hypothetical protein